MAQGVGQDSLVLSHYDEYNLRNLKFALIGLAIILAGVLTWVMIEGNRCTYGEIEAGTDTWGQICDTHMIYGWVAGIPIIIIGIIVTIYWFRLTSLRKSAMVAEAAGDYEEAISLVKKLKDYTVMPSLTQKLNASPQLVQTPQVQQQYAQPQPQPGSRSTRECPNCGSSCNYDATQCQMCLATLPILASDRGLGNDGIATSSNPTINVNIQNIQPDSGAKNIHIQDSVVNDSDLL
jgi:hypothetical protein